MERKIRIGLIGAGMFGGDVHMRTYADLERNGISPWLGRIGMDDFARTFADVEFELAGIATHTLESAKRAQVNYGELAGRAVPIFYGETPWEDLTNAFTNIDILAVATPDNLHFAPTVHALKNGIHAIVEKPMVLDMVEADQIITLSKKK